MNHPESLSETLLSLPEGEGRIDEGGSRTKGDLKKSYDGKPLVTIITVVFNGERYLEETISSVLDQTYDNVEYIIIDGASTDGTLAIIKRYEDQIDYWVSEKDSGIYDAMNKGLRVATGRIIAILNADDRYEPDAVALSIDALLKGEADYSYASVVYHDEESTGEIRPLDMSACLPRAFFEMPYPHITAFIRKEVYAKVGLFDSSFKIAGDHDLALRIILQGHVGIEVKQTIAHIVAGGVSSDFKANIESSRVARKYGASSIRAYYELMGQYVKHKLVDFLPARLIKSIQKSKSSRFS